MADLRCEFWIEFENGARMHAEMLDKVETNLNIIPLTDNSNKF
jgi:hypothetical protein